MSGATGAGSYRAVLALPCAARTFAAALIGRLSYGTLPLALLFTVRDATSSFTVAGASVAVLGLMSLSLPAKSRLVDRRGQPVVLVPLALVSGSALVAVAALASARVATPSAYVGVAALAGLTAPPLGPAMRSTWRVLTEGSGLKPRAYALDSVGEEALYLVGPLLTGVVIGAASAAIALLLTALLLVGGTIGMAVASASRRTRGTPGEGQPPRRPCELGPLRAPGFVRLVTTLAVAAAALSIAFTSIAARAQAAGVAGAAGYIEAAVATGSVAGAIAWGRRTHRRPSHVHLAGLTAALALGPAVAAVAHGLAVVGVAMAITGMAVAPLFVVCYLAADELAPPGRETEASTWVNVMNNLGTALGGGLAGVLVDRAGASLGFLVAALLLLATSAGAGLVRPAG